MWIAMTCKKKADDGDRRRYRYFGPDEDELDHQILGVFFSRIEADECAKEYVEKELDYKEDDDSDDDEMEKDDEDDDDDFQYSFEWDGEDYDIFEEDERFRMLYSKVWVERYAIEDATIHFRK